MYYEIIKDRDKFLEFIEWLPELKHAECYYFQLLARNKYLEDKSLIKGDRYSLKRITATDKKYILNKVEQLEVKLGTYRTGKEDKVIPQEALALYCSVNPRNLELAAKKNLIELANLITTPYNGYNPASKALSAIQDAGNKSTYFDFDFDHVSIEDIKAQIEGKINFDCLTIIKTFGGFHCLVNLNKIAPEYQSKYYNLFKKINGCDVSGTDKAIPVVGCTQGGFTPHFVNLV